MPDFVFTFPDLLASQQELGLIGSGSWNGLEWGIGNGISIDEMTGLHDMPTVLTADHDRPNDHGMLQAHDYLTGRSIVVGFRIIGSSVADYQNKLNQVSRALVTTADELPFLVFDSQRQINVRCRRRALQFDPKGEKVSVTGRVIAEFFATDPRIYDAAVRIQSCGLPTGSTGVPFPITFPFRFGTGSSGGNMSVINDGSFATRPVFTISGPCINPKIENVQSGKYVQFSISLGASDYLTVNVDSHAVILNGDGSSGSPGAARRNTLVRGSQWFDLDPGTSTLNFRASDFELAARLTATFRSAWI